MQSAQQKLSQIELEESVVPSTSGTGMLVDWWGGGIIIGGVVVVGGAIVIVP